MKGMIIKRNWNSFVVHETDVSVCCYLCNSPILNPRFQNFHDNSVLTCLPDLLLSFLYDLQTLLGIENYCSHLLITAT